MIHVQAMRTILHSPGLSFKKRQFHPFIDQKLVTFVYQRLLRISSLEENMHQEHDSTFADFQIKALRKYRSIYRRDNSKIVDVHVFHRLLGKQINFVQIKGSSSKNAYGFLIQTNFRRELCIKYSKYHDIILLQLPSSLQGTIIDFEFVCDPSRDLISGILILLAQNKLRPDMLIKIAAPAPSTSNVVLKSEILYPVVIKNFEILLEEHDESFFLDMSISKTSSIVIIHHQSKSITEITLFYNVHSVLTRSKILLRDSRQKCFVQHGNDGFYAIIKDIAAKCFQLYHIQHEVHDLSDLSLLTDWTPIWTSDTATLVEDFDVFHGVVIIYGTVLGNPSILRISIQGEAIRIENVISTIREKYPELPSHFTIQPGINRDFYSQTFSYSISSLLCPLASFKCDLFSENVKMFRFRTSQLNLSNRCGIFRYQVRSHDSVEVPLTLVYDKSKRNFSQLTKTLMSAYGAYGKCLPLHFRPFYYELLQRGWTIAFAHVRGGGELGLPWHAQGSQLNKKHSYLDFLAVSDYLLRENITMPSKLCAEGDSAGGLVVGASLNQCPQQFAGVVLRNAFLNISCEVRNPSSLLREHEVDEWGDAGDSDVFEFIQSYCPFANIQKQAYPAIYVQYGAQDSIVNPFNNSVLWAEKIKEHQHSDIIQKPIIVRVGNHDHHGSLLVEEQCYESALEIAFLESCVKD